VRIVVVPERPAEFELRLRIPAWCSGASVKVNGEKTGEPVPGRYMALERTWRGGDAVELDLPMRAEALRSRPEIVDNAGGVAFRRGPLVYCLEDVDARGIDLDRVVLLSEEAIENWEPDLLGGVHALQIRVAESSCPNEPYPRGGDFRIGSARTVRLVPFCARANRSDDPAWRVWLPRA
jgi:DUF1680 family protein